MFPFGWSGIYVYISHFFNQFASFLNVSNDAKLNNVLQYHFSKIAILPSGVGEQNILE